VRRGPWIAGACGFRSSVADPNAAAPPATPPVVAVIGPGVRVISVSVISAVWSAPAIRPAMKADPAAARRKRQRGRRLVRQRRKGHRTRRRRRKADKRESRSDKQFSHDLALPVECDSLAAALAAATDNARPPSAVPSSCRRAPLHATSSGGLRRDEHRGARSTRPRHSDGIRRSGRDGSRRRIRPR
jgi:hypothetical protein